MSATISGMTQNFTIPACRPQAGKHSLTAVSVLVALSLLPALVLLLSHSRTWQAPKLQSAYLRIAALAPFCSVLAAASFLFPMYGELLDAFVALYDGIALYAFAGMMVAWCGHSDAVALALRESWGDAALACFAVPPGGYCCCLRWCSRQPGPAKGAVGAAYERQRYRRRRRKVCCWLAHRPRGMSGSVSSRTDGLVVPRLKLYAGESSGGDNATSVWTSDEAWAPWSRALRRRLWMIGQFAVVKFLTAASVALYNLFAHGDRDPVRGLTDAERGIMLVGLISALVAGNSILTLYTLLQARLRTLPRLFRKLAFIKLVILIAVVQRVGVSYLLQHDMVTMPPTFRCTTTDGVGGTRFWPLREEYGAAQFLAMIRVVEMATLGVFALFSFPATDVRLLPADEVGPGDLVVVQATSAERDRSKFIIV